MPRPNSVIEWIVGRNIPRRPPSKNEKERDRKNEEDRPKRGRDALDGLPTLNPNVRGWVNAQPSVYSPIINSPKSQLVQSAKPKSGSSKSRTTGRIYPEELETSTDSSEECRKLARRELEARYKTEATKTEVPTPPKTPTPAKASPPAKKSPVKTSPAVASPPSPPSVDSSSDSDADSDSDSESEITTIQRGSRRKADPPVQSSESEGESEVSTRKASGNKKPSKKVHFQDNVVSILKPGQYHDSANNTFGVSKEPNKWNPPKISNFEAWEKAILTGDAPLPNWGRGFSPEYPKPVGWKTDYIVPSYPYNTSHQGAVAVQPANTAQQHPIGVYNNTGAWYNNNPTWYPPHNQNNISYANYLTYPNLYANANIVPQPINNNTTNVNLNPQNPQSSSRDPYPKQSSSSHPGNNSTRPKESSSSRPNNNPSRPKESSSRPQQGNSSQPHPQNNAGFYQNNHAFYPNNNSWSYANPNGAVYPHYNSGFYNSTSHPQKSSSSRPADFSGPLHSSRADNPNAPLPPNISFSRAQIGSSSRPSNINTPSNNGNMAAPRRPFHETLTEAERRSKTPATDRLNAILAERNRNLVSQGRVPVQTRNVIIQNVASTVTGDPQPNAFYDPSMNMMRVYGTTSESLVPSHPNAFYPPAQMQQNMASPVTHLQNGAPHQPHGQNAAQHGAQAPQYFNVPQYPGQQPQYPAVHMNQHPAQQMPQNHAAPMPQNPAAPMPQYAAAPMPQYAAPPMPQYAGQMPQWPAQQFTGWGVPPQPWAGFAAPNVNPNGNAPQNGNGSKQQGNGKSKDQNKQPAWGDASIAQNNGGAGGNTSADKNNAQTWGNNGDNGAWGGEQVSVSPAPPAFPQGFTNSPLNPKFPAATSHRTMRNSPLNPNVADATAPPTMRNSPLNPNFETPKHRNSPRVQFASSPNFAPSPPTFASASTSQHQNMNGSQPKNSPAADLNKSKSPLQRFLDQKNGWGVPSEFLNAPVTAGSWASDVDDNATTANASPNPNNANAVKPVGAGAKNDFMKQDDDGFGNQQDDDGFGNKQDDDGFGNNNSGSPPAPAWDQPPIPAKFAGGGGGGGGANNADW